MLPGLRMEKRPNHRSAPCREARNSGAERRCAASLPYKAAAEWKALWFALRAMHSFRDRGADAAQG
jgi:hypothetical protein